MPRRCAAGTRAASRACSSSTPGTLAAVRRVELLVPAAHLAARGSPPAGRSRPARPRPGRRGAGRRGCRRAVAEIAGVRSAPSVLELAGVPVRRARRRAPSRRTAPRSPRRRGTARRSPAPGTAVSRERVHHPVLAPHVVGGGEHVAERRATHAPRSVPSVDRVGQVGPAAGEAAAPSARRPRRPPRRGSQPASRSGRDPAGRPARGRHRATSEPARPLPHRVVRPAASSVRRASACAAARVARAQLRACRRLRAPSTLARVVDEEHSSGGQLQGCKGQLVDRGERLAQTDLAGDDDRARTVPSIRSRGIRCCPSCWTAAPPAMPIAAQPSASANISGIGAHPREQPGQDPDRARPRARPRSSARRPGGRRTPPPTARRSPVGGSACLPAALRDSQLLSVRVNDAGSMPSPPARRRSSHGPAWSAPRRSRRPRHRPVASRSPGGLPRRTRPGRP